MQVALTKKKVINLIKRIISPRPKNVKFILDKKFSRFRKNIIFLEPALRYPSGGGIVTHSHSQLIQDMDYKNFTSQVLFPEEPSFVPTLFVPANNLKKDLTLNPATDFVVVAEVFAVEHSPKLVKMGVKYAINVQNGYLIDSELVYHKKTIDQLNFAYDHADIVIGISDDTNHCIKQIFPLVTSKLVRSFYVIDKAIFKPFKDKKNIITYMPRKLPRHSRTVCLHLANILPPNWELIAIDGLPENEVYEILSESKIFMSFSEFEGLGMPPVMAALSGNKVIGYTGEGGKEYFHLSCFEEIYCGDINAFTNKVIETIESMQLVDYQIDEVAIQELSKMFCKEKQKKYLMELIDRVEALS